MAMEIFVPCQVLDGNNWPIVCSAVLYRYGYVVLHVMASIHSFAPSSSDHYCDELLLF